MPVSLSMRGPVALMGFDDGASNILDVNNVNALLRTFGEAQERAAAIVIAGRPGCYSTGLDYDLLQSGGEAASRLLHAGTDLVLSMVECPRPVVVACTGDALGAAAVSLLCSDFRIGRAGDFKIGMDWVAAGWPVPDLAVELARARLSHRHFAMACNAAQLYAPDEAVEAGFLDSVTAGDVVEEACGVAADLVERLDPAAFEITRRITCGRLSDAIIRAAGDLWRVARATQRGQ
ncbi:MAG: enoyl-CoA hydratase-related protein [Acidimicrobiaceae bacterium]|nr:enoyl-CoA hydratase-related protein [Acidimicrobiaceae bacterium]